MSAGKLVKLFGYSLGDEGRMALHKSPNGGLMRVRDVQVLLRKVWAHVRGEHGAGAALQVELDRYKRVLRGEKLVGENIYRNDKNKKLYVVLYADATNATNAQDGQRMAVYVDREGRVFCREYSEFVAKFTKLGEEAVTEEQ